jgi:uncharacterized membrane protein
MAIVALVLLALTADKGGSLVYGHGLGVTMSHTELSDHK